MFCQYNGTASRVRKLHNWYRQRFPTQQRSGADSVLTPAIRYAAMKSLLSDPIRALETVVLIGIGGFAGSNFRHLVAQVAPTLPATLAVNTLGSFLLGLVIYEQLSTDKLTTETRLLVSTGFLSSFTTYSTFALQSVRSQPRWLIGNVLITYTLGFASVIAARSIITRYEQQFPQ